MFDEQSLKNIEEIEKMSSLPTGTGKISRGECEAGGLNPVACMFCPYGHMLECHYPYTCDEIECSHYQTEMETENHEEFESP